MSDNFSSDIDALLASTDFDDSGLPPIVEDRTVIPSGLKSSHVSQPQEVKRKRLPSEPVDLMIKNFDKITEFLNKS